MAAGRVNRDGVKSILLKKCEPKGVIVDRSLLARKRHQFAAAWHISLKHQVQEVPDFDEVFEKMLDDVDEYSSSSS